MVIQHNLLAMNANRQFKINNVKAKKATEKLSSGYKINRAADDAAGLAISEKMRRQIRGLNQSAQNIQEGIGYVQTADGALEETQDILQRINELAVKSANGTNDAIDREYIDEEVQELKKELQKIFTTTSFNDVLIWEPRGDAKKVVGWEKKQAATFKMGTKEIDVTNANCDVLASGSYLINADDTGIFVSWTGYDGEPYNTEKIDWDTFKKNNYTFEISDYFGDPSDGKMDNLYDVNGDPVFKYQIALNVEETTTKEDIIKCIDQTYTSPSEYTGMSVDFEDSNSKNGVSVSSSGIYYTAAYASNANGTGKSSTTLKDPDTYGYDFDAPDDIFLEPIDKNGNPVTSSSGNLTSYPPETMVAAAKQSTEGWEFTFTMDGIGKVTATSTTMTYGAYDRTDDDENFWWHWVTLPNSSPYQSGNSWPAGGLDATLGNVMSVLTGDKSDSTPGLLNKTNDPADGKGAADAGGYIQIRFDLESENEFAPGNNDVGYFYLRIEVSNTDTEESVLKKITDALNDNTVLDFYTSKYTSHSQTIYQPSIKTNKIDVPIYGGINQFYVQAGVEANQHINVKYDCLSLMELELEDTNVLTQEAAGQAIESVKNALHEISTQRAAFGAYQNRLEHAYNINKNIEENTQASESVIRDADMAKTMVEYSKINILQQAGQAILSQANKNAENILSLLS